MIKIEKFTGNKTYMYPNGAIATAEKLKADFPAVEIFPHIIETDEAGQVCFAVQNLSAVSSQMGIDPALTEDVDPESSKKLYQFMLEGNL